ncbi:MAG TPA: SAM-dependent methyltransferase, partial [Thermotogota bacterium]|nr:SAM-dependent methyltransferase [Thermotogota bacterium]
MRIEKASGRMTLVASPIGNLEDFSFRGVRILREADFILAEDTRRSLILINHYQIGRKAIISFSEQKIERKLDAVLERLRNGENGVLLTDSGMPAVADPGSKLMRACHEHRIPVDVIPGPS